MDDARRCTAKSKQSQQRCKNAALLGAHTCRFHGSATKKTKAASARRVLEALVGPALVELRNLIADPATPPAVKLAAVRDILDRTGYKPVEQMEVVTIGWVEKQIASLEKELAE